MDFIVYDGSFEGFLTVIFECYARKIIPLDICREQVFRENCSVVRLIFPVISKKQTGYGKRLK